MQIAPGRRFVLEYKQVSNMRIKLRGKLISNACKKSVLIKVVVSNLFSGVDADLVRKKQEGCLFFQLLCHEWHGERETITEPPVKIIFIQ